MDSTTQLADVIGKRYRSYRQLEDAFHAFHTGVKTRLDADHFGQSNGITYIRVR